jgi:hypothetical protein
MSRAGVGTSQVLKGCHHTDTTFSLDLAGPVGDAGPIELSVTLAGTYTGPKTYRIENLDTLNPVVAAGVNSVPNDGSLELLARGGTFTIAADEASGTIDASLVRAHTDSVQGQVSGTWRCPPLD